MLKFYMKLVHIKRGSQKKKLGTIRGPHGPHGPRMSGPDRATKNTKSVITSLVVGIFEQTKHHSKGNFILYKIGTKKISKK